MPGRIRVLYVHSNLRLGGAETLRLAQLRYMKRDIVEPMLAVHALGESDGERWMVDQLEGIDVPVVDLKAHSPFAVLAALGSTIARLRPHLLQTSMFEANTIGRIASVASPSMRVLTEEHNRYEWKRPLHIACDFTLARVSDRIICCSDAVANFAARQAHIDRRRFFTLHNCLDPHRLVVRRSREEVRRELGTPDGALVVIAVGRVSAQKSFGRAIDAFARAPIAGDAELWIVGGDGGEYDDVQRRANALSAPGRRVRLLGERHDVGDLLRASDVFAHSARWEGFGIVILEAMASKLPVVAFANDGVPEVVDDASGTLLVDGDIDGFARALGRYAADPFDRRAAGEAGARRVEQRFSPTVHVNRLVGLYHDVLRRPWWRLDA